MKIPMSFLGRKGGQKGKKVHEFHFLLELDPHYYFHATLAFLADFEIFLNKFESFSTRKSGYDPVGPKFLIVNTNI